MKRFLPILLGVLLTTPLLAVTTTNVLSKGTNDLGLRSGTADLPKSLGLEVTNSLSDDPEAKYSKDIENRTQNILNALALEDPKKVTSVHDTIMAQWRALRTWHDENDAKLKKNKGTNEVATINASLKTLHNEFLAKLSKDLTPAQVDVVKDKLTYGVVQVTYNAYLGEYPGLTDAEKKQILAWLIEARETSMDQGSSNEKHAVFGKYKGRINNYLSKEGYDAKTGKKKTDQPAELSNTNQPAK